MRKDRVPYCLITAGRLSTVEDHLASVDNDNSAWFATTIKETLRPTKGIAVDRIP